MRVRFFSMLIAVALLATPALAAAQAARSSGPSGMRLGAFIGMEDGAGPAGMALRVDGELQQKPLSPMVGLSLVLSAGYTRFHDEYSTYWGYPYYDYWSVEATNNVFKFAPAARFTFGRSPKIRPYADAGIGIYHSSIEIVETAPAAIGLTNKATASATGLMFRFAGGIEFFLSDGMSIGGEVGITPYTGDFDESTTTLMFLAMFRM